MDTGALHLANHLTLADYKTRSYRDVAYILVEGK
jgi:hypothetical protein